MVVLDGEIVRLNVQSSNIMDSTTFPAEWKEVKECLEALNKEIIVKKQGKFIQDKLAFLEGYAYKWTGKLPTRKKNMWTCSPQEMTNLIDLTESDSSVFGCVYSKNSNAKNISKSTSLVTTNTPQTLNIINLTPFTLTPEEERVLQLGLGYFPSEPINIFETIKDLYLFAHNLTFRFIFDKDRQRLNLEKELAERTKHFSMQEFRALRNLMLFTKRGHRHTLFCSSRQLPRHNPSGPPSS